MFKSKFKTTGDYTICKNGTKYQSYTNKQCIICIKPYKSVQGFIRRTDHFFGSKRVYLFGEMNGYSFSVQASSYRLAKVAAKKLTRVNA